MFAFGFGVWSVGVAIDVCGGAGIDVAGAEDGKARIFDFGGYAVCGSDDRRGIQYVGFARV